MGSGCQAVFNRLCLECKEKTELTSTDHPEQRAALNCMVIDSQLPQGNPLVQLNVPEYSTKVECVGEERENFDCKEILMLGRWKSA